MVYNQIVTWTAFAILAMFFLQIGSGGDTAWSLEFGRGQGPKEGAATSAGATHWNIFSTHFVSRDADVEVQGVLRAEARPQDVQPMSRARRAPDPRKGSPS